MTALHTLLLTPMQMARLKSFLDDNSHGGEYPQKGCVLCEIAKKLEEILGGETKEPRHPSGMTLDTSGEPK